ncbi:MAG: hypothetical protein K1X66_08700 [Verrucomicrobiae bacterium]|nr:hypothetical protein [Verrucomicrobiae bacterium]
MSTIQELESAVTRLSPTQYNEFRHWLKEYDNKLWDKEMKEDAESGRLDALAAEALDDLKKGRCTDL